MLLHCFIFLLSISFPCCCRLFTWSEYSLYKMLAYWIFLQQHPNLQVLLWSSVLCNKSNYSYILTGSYFKLSIVSTLYKTDRFLVAIHLFSNTEKTSKCLKDIWDRLALWLVCYLFCSYHILVSSAICYWTDEQQHGM